MSTTGLSAADVAENGISPVVLERLQATINSRWQSAGRLSKPRRRLY